MAFAVTGTDWNALTSVTTPGASANPVLKLTGNGGVLWAKAAIGGKRIEFAGDVMGRVGFDATGTRVISGVELATARAKIALKIALPAKAMLDLFEEKLNAGADFILMQNVPGQEFGKHIRTFTDDQAAIAEFVRVLGNGTTQDDVARLIAADLLLGNFDRIAYNATQDSAKFHSGNFIYEANHFLPIDNDTVAPSVQHVRLVNNKPATKEDLYRTVIRGAVLRVKTTEAFPAAEQASMDALLGANAVDSVAKALEKMLGSVMDAQQKATLRGYAVIIAPKVKTVMRELIDELKTPGGGRVGLNALMKAQNNLEGMDYTTFKVKGRFAQFLLNDNMNEADATERAVNYGKYRDWKAQFDEYLSSPPTYIIPTVQLRDLGKMDKLKRGVQSAGVVLSKALPVDLVDTSLEQIMKDAATVKRDVRKPGNMDEAKLRALYATWSAQPDSDNRVVKVKVLIIANLLRIDLTKLTAFLDEIVATAPHDGVAAFYCKAISARGLQVSTLIQAYSAKISALKPALETLSKSEQEVVGVPALNHFITEFANSAFRARTMA